MKRRTFLKSLPATVGITFACNNKNKYTAQIQSTGDPLYDSFRRPKASARPFYRWWWNDNRVTAEEVRRQIGLMAEQGAGGVEINPIALPEVYEGLPGEKLAWLSRDWNTVLQAAVDEARRQDMLVDLIVGTGWPFGGTFLNNDETIQGIELVVEEVQGPVSLEKKIDIPDDPDHKVMQIKLFPKTINSLDQGIDLTYHVEDENILRVDIPNGEWDLYILTRRNKFRNVMFGTQGADGPVLDHFNERAVNKYLNRMSTILNPLFGGSMNRGIRAMFCDSIELEGANWTSDFTREFLDRRGYDVEPYLPLIISQVNAEGEFADTLERVRYDHSLTLAELFTERFILPYHNWCLENGVASRYQAYGHPWLYTDLLDGYLIPDIPESDQWLYNGGWVKYHRIDAIRYAIWNKYASSGGHLTGKPVISCEAMTNTRGVFEATLEYIKQATDLNIVGGVNHLVLHGFNYSPPDAEFPGWIRFGTYFNENNTWWPYTKLWSDYAARLCQIFQESQYRAQVAILGPTPDMWSHHGLDRNPWNTTPDYLHDLWQALNHHGYCSDYVNNTIIENATFENGEIQYGPMAYKVLVCCDVRSIRKNTAKAMLEFVANGGTILFINEVPERSPGFVNRDINDAAVMEIFTALFEDYGDRVKMRDLDEIGDITSWIGERMKELQIPPAAHISPADERLFMINHYTTDREIYFFCNADRQRTLSFDAKFPIKNKTPWEWNAETGSVTVYGKADELLNIRLSPLQSLLLVFEESNDEPVMDKKIPDTMELDLTGSWQLKFHPVHGEMFVKSLPELVNFAENPALQTFSGTVVYKKSFQWGKKGDFILDLGEVYDIAQVELNGESLGACWWGEKQYNLGDKLIIGENHLYIQVTTTLFNYVQSLKENKIVEYWLKRRADTGLVPAGLVGPVTIWNTKQD